MSGEASQLWDWAVAAYDREGVDEVCLRLQDGYGQNVPYLLWAAWAAVEGRPLDEETLEAGADTARTWEETAVRPLRGLRRELKKPVPDMGDAARERLRTQIKAVELEAERLLLGELESLTPAPAGRPRPLAAGLVEAAKVWTRVVPRADLEALAARLPG